MDNPIIKINEWLTKEKQLGSADPERVVLATAGKDNVPHSRIVAIREITEKGVLFFTQNGTGKVTQLTENPMAAMTLWLPLQQRQINLEGEALALSKEENQAYWDTLPVLRQLRFRAYASTSGKPIQSLAEIDNRYAALLKEFSEKPVPMSNYYCGFRLKAKVIYFYTLGMEAFSEYIQYRFQENQWTAQLLSP